MSHVSAQTISQNLHTVHVGPDGTYTYSGEGLGMTFIVSGTHEYSGDEANAHLLLNESGPEFNGTVTLGPYAEVKMEGVGSPTSYSYTPQHGHTPGHITFWYAMTATDSNGIPHAVPAMAEYGFTLNAKGPIEVATVPGANQFGGSGTIDITSGIFPGLSYGLHYSIHPHVAGALV